MPATFRLNTGTTSARSRLSMPRPQLLTSMRSRRCLPGATCALLRIKEFARSQTWWEKCTRRRTTRRSRPMCNAHGSTRRTQACVRSTWARQAPLRCSFSTMQTRFHWVRASTRPRSLTTLQVLSVASVRTSQSRRMSSSPGSDQTTFTSLLLSCCLKRF